jgi:pre-mRNA-splicing factor CWC22
VFKEDPEYETHEQQYKAIVKELLGDDEEEEEGGEGAGEGTHWAVRVFFGVF